jgi:hypothetical protein
MKHLNLKANPLGCTTPRNPRLAVVGTGQNAYIWIGNDAGFVGIAQNTPETRRFLARALARFEKGLPRRKGKR